jgi:starch synthase
MDILQIASEMTPIAKVGGLGDVLMGLTRELLWKGHSVLPVLPAYGVIDTSQLTPDGKEEFFSTSYNGTVCKAKVTYYHFDGKLPLALLDTEEGLFRNRETIYGDGVPEATFIFFCRAVVEWILATNRKPDIVHIHDWPTALVPSVYQALTGKKPPFGTVFTVHNFEYQGRCSWDDLARTGLFQHNFSNPALLQDPVHPCLNLVKAGLLTADFSTTVSPTYANEVRTPAGGRGLHEILTGLHDRFFGILNGVDYTFWNPEIDPYIGTRYGVALPEEIELRTKKAKDPDSFSAIQKAKRLNRDRLFFSIGVEPLENVPLIASVSRLVNQKGIWFIKDLFYKAEELNFQCLVLGSVPEPGAEKAFAELDLFLRSRGRGAVFQISDEGLAHKAYAASDLFVVPSIVEPCGLTQMIALKYGSVPIVRKTGGLADTIIDVDTHSCQANGFVFEEPQSQSFISCTQRALALFSDRTQWGGIMLRGMKQDYSWNIPCDAYISVYNRALRARVVDQEGS